jgi:hypothetical protein
MAAPATLDALEADRRARAQAQGTPLVEIAPSPRPTLPQAQNELADMDPLSVIEATKQAQIQQADVFDQQIAQIQEPVQQQISTLESQYQIDLNSIYNANLDEQSRNNRINQLNANYQKRIIQARNKVAPQVQRLQQAKQMAIADANLQAATATAKLAGAASAAEEMGLSPARTKALLLNQVGVRVPMTMFETGASQTPAQMIDQGYKMVSIAERTLGQFQIEPAKDRWIRADKPVTFKVLKPITEWKNPQADKRDPDDYREATPEEQAVAEQAIDNYNTGMTLQHEGSTRLVGQRVQNIALSAAGLARDVAGMKPKRRAGADPNSIPTLEVSQMSDEELRRLASGGR